MEPPRKSISNISGGGKSRTWRNRVGRFASWVGLLLFLSIVGGSNPVRADARADIASILSDRDYQTALPQTPKPVKIKLPLRFEFGPVAEMLIWVIAAVIVILLAAYLAKLASGATWLSKKAGKDDGPDIAGFAKTSMMDGAGQTPFEEIERLAQAGRFGDAVHLLLLLCFEALRDQSPTARDAALTSREVLQRASLPAPAQSNLAFIVSAVEIGHFGGHNVDRSVYEQCLDRYHDIVATETP
jgi:hypothetical protein